MSTTIPDDPLDELLYEWQRLPAAGRPAPEEFCRNRPDLAGEFRRRVEAVRRVEKLLEPDGEGGGGTATLSAPVPPGYELLAEVGRGGMGVVYKARRLDLNRLEAVKTILPERFAGPAAVERFRFEAEAAAGLDHPNIVGVYRVGDVAGRPFLAMRWVDGLSLADRLRAGPLPAGDAAGVVGKVARAVHFAHRQGILHRDLKPANILLDRTGEPHVSDFGVARRLNGPPHLTEPGGVVGTLRYMAPEQADGSGNLTVAADVYALGVVLYESLTGRVPFEAAGYADYLRFWAGGQPASPRSLVPAVPSDLDAVCLRCLERDPRDRYPTAEALADDLDRFARGEPVAARPPGLWDWLRHLARTRPDPHPRYSWEVTAWFGAAVLAANAGVDRLVRAGGPALGVWGINAAAVVAMAAVLWWYMLRRFRHLPATERHSLIIAAGHLASYLALTAAYVPLSLTARADPALGMYPALFAVSGIGLFTLGSTNWSRFFPIGLGMIALAPVAAAVPAVGALLYGGATAGVMWYWAVTKLRGFGRPEETANAPRGMLAGTEPFVRFPVSSETGGVPAEKCDAHPTNRPSR